jgi:hypothetical protein
MRTGDSAHGNLYRILTENKNKIQVLRLAKKHFRMLKGYTVYEGAGYWKGIRENCIIIEIDDCSYPTVEAEVYYLAREIKVLNRQTAVLVQKIPLKSILI